MIEPWTPAAGYIRIVRRPEGEAPEWVRDAWIGLELPLTVEAPIKSRIVGGVLTMPRTRLGYWWAVIRGRSRMQEGFLVDANAAVRVLERRNPTAAIWWRTKAADCLLPQGQFLFDLPASEPSTTG